MRKSPEQHLHNSLVTQAGQGSWSQGFDLRELHEDPWNLGVMDPEIVHFEAPDEQKDRVVELRTMLFSVVRPFLITDGAWDKLKDVVHTVLENPDVKKFAQERQANIFLATPHTMFADLGITAGAAHEVMESLPPEHPFGSNTDPREKQTIVAGRILSMLKHPDFDAVTGGLPIMEGMMLPLAGVTTTHSANGSSLHTRAHLGDKQVREMNDRTKESMAGHMTHGNFIFHLALHGSQVKWDEDGYTPKRTMASVSKGTRDIILSQNQGEPATHKNLLVGVALDCPSFARDGSYSAQDAGVGLMPEVLVPTERSDFDLFQRALAEHASDHRQLHLPGFRYGNEHEIVDHHDVKRIREITLTNLNDA